MLSKYLLSYPIMDVHYSFNFENIKKIRIYTFIILIIFREIFIVIFKHICILHIEESILNIKLLTFNTYRPYKYKIIDILDYT